MLKKLLEFGWLLLLVPGIAAQQGRVYSEGGRWAQEMTGSLSGAPNLRIKVDAGSVRVEGGSRSGITYVVHNRAFTSTRSAPSCAETPRGWSASGREGSPRAFPASLS